MRVIHIYAAESSVSSAQKKLLVENVTRAIVACGGVGKTRDTTFVLVHEVPEGEPVAWATGMTHGYFACHIPGALSATNSSTAQTSDDAVDRMRAHWSRDRRGSWRRSRSH